ncbi:MAG: hypothetical protein GY869_06660 [Planctomycetes bacterium]|nr:hypothetical protein [Planctomycetota bacterium]
MMKQLVFYCLVVGGMVYLSSCHGASDYDRIIRVDMEWREAESYFKERGLENQMMAVIPRESPNGGFMGLNNYAIARDTVLSVEYDKVGGRERILNMWLITNTDRPRSMQESVPILEINLRDFK